MSSRSLNSTSSAKSAKSAKSFSRTPSIKASSKSGAATNKFNAFFEAANNGDVDTLKQLLAKEAAAGGRRNKKKNKGPVLHKNSTNSKGWTALHVASLKGHYEVVKFLVMEGAQLNPPQNEGWTPLHLAAQKGHDIICSFLLVGDKLMLEDRQAHEWTALHLAAQSGHVSTVKLLLDRGAKINATRQFGWTALHIACQYNHLELIELLIERGANLECQDQDGWTPIFVAAQHGHTDVMEVLVAKGANVDAKCLKKGATPLHTATYHGHVEAVRILLEKGGADLHSTMEEEGGSKTAVELAHMKEHAEVAEYLAEQRKMASDTSTTEGGDEAGDEVGDEAGDLDRDMVMGAAMAAVGDVPPPKKGSVLASTLDFIQETLQVDATLDYIQESLQEKLRSLEEMAKLEGVRDKMQNLGENLHKRQGSVVACAALVGAMVAVNNFGIQAGGLGGMGAPRRAITAVR